MSYTQLRTTPKKKKNRKKKLVIMIVIATCLIGAGFFGYKYVQRNKQTNHDNTNNINLSPPTEQEKSAGDEQKKEIVDRQELEKNKNNQTQSSAPNNNSKKSVTILITDANQYDDVIEVRSFMPDHYEDGSCKITFTKGNLLVSKTTSAYRDATTTICTNPLFKRSEFSTAGEWQVTVEYTSNSAQAKSKPQTVSIK